MNSILHLALCIESCNNELMELQEEVKKIKKVDLIGVTKIAQKSGDINKKRDDLINELICVIKEMSPV